MVRRRLKTLDRALRVLTVNTADSGGGAERVAFELSRFFRCKGAEVWFAVGSRREDADWILAMQTLGFWGRGWSFIAERIRGTGGSGAARTADFLADVIGQPSRWIHRRLGYEDFDFPGTRRLLSLPPRSPDLLHIHNMHGGYFDLRELSALSARLPVVLTLHDAWLLSGHCAHSFDCDRWRTGCGDCPDLTVPPSIARDNTAVNWKRKRQIYEKSRVYVATPSEWLMAKVRESMLAAAIVEARVIPNGVVTTTFHPGDRDADRSLLGIPRQAKVVLFAANGIRRNPWKDYTTLRSALSLLARQPTAANLLFLGIGESAPSESFDGAELRFVPYQKDPQVLAAYYRAADLYVHASRADTFPNVVVEALACGTPVVATAIGGIPEQIRGLRSNEDDSLNTYTRADATGVLVPPGNPEILAEALRALLQDDELRARLASNAAVDAEARFNVLRQVDAYYAWYEEILGRRAGSVMGSVN